MEFSSVGTKSLSMLFKVSLLTYQMFPVSTKLKVAEGSLLVVKIGNLPKQWIITTSSNDCSRKKS